MATAPYHPAPPSVILDHLLRSSPFDVLLFDVELVCRYAAPAGEALLGRSAAELVGKSAGTMFGADASDLLTALRLAADGAATYQYPEYHYEHQDAETRTFHCWSVEIEPVLLHDYRGADEFRGVLVTLADIGDLTDERDRLRASEARLAAENASLQLQLEDHQQRAVLAQERVRTLLAPVAGYLQLLARRPELLAGRDRAATMEHLLPALVEIVELVDRSAR